MEITIELPDGWSSTNDIDVFRTEDLVSSWWSLLGTTNGSNSVTYTDTGSGDSDVVLRFYRAGDGETDTDSDGYVDAREELMYHSDPDDADSYPVSVSGSVTHSNTPQSGTIHVIAVTSSNSWELGRYDDLSSPGSFEITGIPNLDDYWIKAWRDWCDNDRVDLWEATGTATNCPIYLTNSVSNIVVTLTDPPASISGTLGYTGKQEGTWIAMVTTVSTSWTATVSDEASGAGFYHLPNLSQTCYYVKAWIDADGDDACDTSSEANSSWTNNPISLSNSVWNIDFEIEDVNGDGDSMPDWWEILHFGNTNQTDTGDYDSDQMPNSWEYTWDFCPTNSADAMWDYDGDGYFVYEYKHDTDPHNVGSVPSPGSSGRSSQTPSPTVTVVTNGISIQAALDQATNAYDIVVVEAGTYSITNDIDFPTNTLMLISDEGASVTVLSATSSRLVEFSGSAIGSHTALQGFTLTGGGDVNDGAGIRCDNGASPTIVSCVVSNCAADDDGGGFFCDASSPELRNCVCTDNSAADKGGGVYCKGGAAATFTNCWVIENTSADHGGGMYYTGSSGMVLSCSISTNTAAKDGGGIYCEGGSPALQSCYLLGNLAQDDGGAIRTVSDAMTLTSCTVSDNTAYDHGGGFYGNGSAAVLSGCVVSENTAVDGGGIGFNASTVTVKRCVIVDNWAHVDGGGIRAKDSTPVIRGCLIARNRAFGHGGGVQTKGSTATLVLESCTVADNESRLSGGGVSATESATASATNTVVWGNSPDQLSGATGLSHSCIQGGATGTSIVTNDPAMTPYWFRLKTGSSCTNAGTNATWMTSAYDIDGEARITNTIVDIGSDELVDSDGDGMGDAWELYYFGTLNTNGTADSDGDGLLDADEYAYDGDPTDSDTDGDGFSDGDEVTAGMSVAEVDDLNTLTLEYRFGDTNGASGSETYILTIENTTNATDKLCVTNTDFGTELTGEYDFTKGAEYEITLDHHESDTNWATIPDYDYHVYIEDVGGPTGWVCGTGFLLCDTNGILGNHWEDEQTTAFDATNRSAQLYFPDLRIFWDGILGGEQVSGITNTVSAGHSIRLEAVLAVGSLSGSNSEWTVGGEVIADYYHNDDWPDLDIPTDGSVTALTDTNSTDISFYWIDGNTNAADGPATSVLYSCEISGFAWEAEAWFDVKKPKTTVGTATGNTFLDYDVDAAPGGWLRLTYGLYTNTVDSGFLMTNITFSAPWGFGGTNRLFWTQIINERRDTTITGTETNLRESIGLDGNFHMHGTPGVSWIDDCPYIVLGSNVLSAEVEMHDATLYLMYEPEPIEATVYSRPVPLYKVDWTWEAAATNLSPGTTNWMAATNWSVWWTNSFSTPAEATALPEWTNNAAYDL